MTNKRIVQFQMRYPKSYQRWTDYENSQLIKYLNQRVPNKEIASLLQRSPGSISSRIAKIKFLSNIKQGEINQINAKFAFSWESVLQSEQNEYFFPTPINEFMKKKYRYPAIYRWIIEWPDNYCDEIFYIGETIKLCPDRLSSYLSPGPKQQTNLRLNLQFNEFVTNGAKIHLEILRIKSALLNDLLFCEEDLKHQDIRRLIERLLIILYRKQGLNLLNL